MELCYDPVQGERVTVSSTREERPWQSSAERPLCPGSGETGAGWRVLVFDNKHPAQVEDPPEPRRHQFCSAGEAKGKCLVVVETIIRDMGDLSDLGVGQVELVIEKTIEVHQRCVENE